MYKTVFSDKIIEIEVIRKSSKQVVYLNSYGREVREAKLSEWHSYHEIKELAIEHLINKQQKIIEDSLLGIELAKLKIEKIKAL